MTSATKDLEIGTVVHASSPDTRYTLDKISSDRYIFIKKAGHSQYKDVWTPHIDYFHANLKRNRFKIISTPNGGWL